MLSVVLVSTSNGMNTVRALLEELIRAGFIVGAACCSDSPLAVDDRLRAVRVLADRTTFEDMLGTVDDLVSRLDADLLIPCDEASISLLSLARERVSDDKRGSLRLAELLAACLGGGGTPPPSRSMMVEMVGALGVRVPKQVIVTPGAVHDLTPLMMPLVVKEDGTCGGGGIHIAISPEEAASKAESLFRTRGRAIGHGIAVQEYIAGPSLSVAFSVFKGRLRAAFAYRIVRREGRFGASIDIAPLVREDLIEVSARVLERFPFTGFGGMDFIDSEDGGPPVFLEMNTRPVRTTHVGRLIGADLCRALADTPGLERSGLNQA